MTSQHPTQPSSTTALRMLQIAFVMSGFCGLIYQSIWSQYLKLFLGHAAYAQTVVLIVFIGGMALGAFAIGERSSRLRNPLIAYAIVEAIIGLCAFVFHSVYINVTDYAYAHILPTTCGAEGWCFAQWGIAVALILPQSILLGTTFPLMTAGVLRRSSRGAGSSIAVLYFLNSLGAVFGVLCSAFILIPAVGLPGTQLAAGLGNISLALLVYMVARAPGSTNTAIETIDTAQDSAPAAKNEVPVLLVVAALTGLSSFIYEVVWVRMLAFVLGSTSRSFEIMLATFILGLALGSLMVRHKIDKIRDTVALLARVQIAMGVLGVGTLLSHDLVYGAKRFFVQAIAHTDAGYGVYTVTSTLIAMVIMLPTTICAGMTLPLITYRLLCLNVGERAIGRVYSVNTLGGIGGVALGMHLLMPLFGIESALVTAGAVDICLGAWLLLRGRPLAKRSWRMAWAVTGLLFLPIAVWALDVDPLKAASGVYRHGRVSLAGKAKVLFAADGKTASVHVIRYPGNHVALATNGKSDGAINLTPNVNKPLMDEWTMTLLGSLPLLHRPEATDVAIIGFGTGMSTATALGSKNVRSVETIEIEPYMVEGARLFSAVVGPAFNDPRSHIIYDDAKSHFARGRKAYDIIVAEPSNPWVSGVSGLFTAEFYAHLSQHLKPGGLMAQWLATYEMDDKLVSSILLAMSQTFPEWVIYQTTPSDLLVIAPLPGSTALQGSKSLLKLDDNAIQRANLGAALKRIGVLDVEQLRALRVGSHRTLGVYARASGAPINSDFFPFVASNASRARFLRSKANAYTELPTEILPILEMLDDAPAAAALRTISANRVIPLEQARSIGAWAVATVTAPSGGADITAPGSIKAEVRGAVRGLRRQSLRCMKNLPINPALLLSDMLTYGGATHGTTTSAVAAPFWRNLTVAPCHARLPAEVRVWIALHRAVAERDAAAMGRHGGILVGAPVKMPRFALEFALAAAMLGHQVAGNPAHAGALWRRHSVRLKPARRNSMLFTVLAAQP